MRCICMIQQMIMMSLLINILLTKELSRLKYSQKQVGDTEFQRLVIVSDILLWIAHY